jgi:DNA-3-methyladenine glycosylase I
VGPTVCYAFMQAVGLANDHVVGCAAGDEIRAAGRVTPVPATRGG